MAVQTVVTVLAALGVGTIMPELSRAMIGYFTNRRERETTDNDRLRHERDVADANARIAREHASDVRRIAINHGVDPALFPSFPRSQRTVGRTD